MNRALLTAVSAACIAALPIGSMAAGAYAGIPEGIFSAHATPASVSVALTVVLHKEMLSIDRMDGLDVISIPGGNVSLPVGAPAVPGWTVRVAVPEGMRATGVRVTALDEITLPGLFRVRPTKLPLPMTAIGSAPLPTGEAERHDASRSGAVPSARAELTGQADLAGQSFAILRVNPLRYMPETGELVLATSMEIVIEGKPGYLCGDYFSPTATSAARLRAESRLKGLVVNPADAEVRTGTLTQRGVEPGSYDYVIITDFPWVDDFTPLADWRTRKGIRSKIVSMGWITTSGGYAGTTLEKVRAFVEDAHATWGATDFLLGADSHIIPYALTSVVIPGYWTEEIPHDTYYADYDDDFVCEVNVGRAPMRSEADIATFVSKMVDYEKNPPLTNWATTAAYFGFDITDPGDGHGEVSKEVIRSMHLPAHWTLDTEYDSEAGTHTADVLAYLSSGHHLVNHHDHCNETTMGTGWITHSDFVTNAEIAALTNGNRQSFCFAVGCNPCDFRTHTSIAEEFVKNASGGGFAFIGNTRTGWGGSIDDPDWYTARQDRFFYRNLFDDGFVYLGENFSDLKNDEYDPADPYNLHEQCFLQLHLIGDPALPIWTDDPIALTVSHPGEVYAGVLNTFTASVEDGRGPIDGATVCLCKGTEVYEVAPTSSGSATLTLTPATSGTLLVTVWAPNHLPYEAEVAVEDDLTGVDTADSDLPTRLAVSAVRPNPSASGCEIVLAIPANTGRVRVAVYNVQGQLVRTLADEVLEAGVHSRRWDGRAEGGSRVSGGIYFCTLESNRGSDSRKLVLLR
jgi:hypothetical protein